MTIKFSMLMHCTTTDDDKKVAISIAGASESVYHPGDTINQSFLDATHELCLKRSALLPANSAIIGSRATILPAENAISPQSRRSRTWDQRYAGSSTECDDPRMALQRTLKAQGNDNNQREYTLHFAPDARIVTGQYKSAGGYDTALQEYFRVLERAFQFQGFDALAPAYRIREILADGTVVPIDTIADAMHNKWIRVLGGQLREGSRRKFKFPEKLLLRKTAGEVWKLEGFTSSARVLMGPDGRIQLYSKKFLNFLFDNVQPNPLQMKVVAKKVGRPFNLYRGRQAARS